MTTFLPISLKVLAGTVALGAATLFTPGEASAQWGGYGGYGNSNYGIRSYGNYGNNGYQYNAYRYNSYYNGPVYHAPSMHYDRVYHTTPHSTPGRGFHTHPLVDSVPHFVPGHFDRAHGNHVHGNPHFHND